MFSVQRSGRGRLEVMHEYFVEFLKFLMGFTLFISLSLAIVYIAGGSLV